MSTEVVSRGPVSSVGRVGELAFTYVRRGRETLLQDSLSRSPWHLLPSMMLEEGGAYTLLVNPSGGLVGGDRLSVRATLGPDTHVLFSTPSANRVYRSLGEAAVQSVDLTVGPGAVLEWVPDVTIPYAGSRFHQTIQVTLAPGATVLLWDALASGRVARGERWAFTDLHNEIRLTAASGDSVLERYRIAGAGETDGIGLVRDWDYLASFYLIGEAVADGESRKKLTESVALILDEERSDLVLGGVSEPAAPGIVVRVAARSAPALQETLEALWSAIRAQCWNWPTPALRRY